MLKQQLLPMVVAVQAATVSLVLAVSAAAQTSAGGAPVALPELVVSATRTPQGRPEVASSVTALDLPALERSQTLDLRSALAAVPGVNIVGSGGAGGPSSIFIRGGSSTQTLFVVDGLPMNDRSAVYNSFLGTADLAGLDRVEVLRGPQSTLYGSAAMGGVVFLETARGSGEPTGTLTVMGGSYGTVGVSVAEQGGTQALSGAGTISHFRTRNAEPKNGFDQWSYATRLETAPAAQLRVGVTLRAQQGDYEETGGRFYDGASVRADNLLFTAYAQWTEGREFVSRLTAGQHQRRYTYVGTWSTDEIRNRRSVVDWQNTWQGLAGTEIVFGATGEQATQGKNGERTAADNHAGYLSATLRPARHLNVTVGLRYDDFETFGSAATWRTGVAWTPRAGTQLHATVGTGFCAPSNDDLNGVPAWGWMANPNLKAERSTGWDAGIEQAFCSGSLTAAATVFRTGYRDRLDYVSNPVTWVGQIVNLTRSASQGVETALTAKLTETTRVRLAYTYLSALDKTAHTRLLRQPRHALDAEIATQPLAGCTVGAGVHFAADRRDSIPLGSRNASIEDYTTVRLFASFAVARNLRAKVRLENALDENYEEAYGYPAMPRRAVASLEWTF